MTAGVPAITKIVSNAVNIAATLSTVIVDKMLLPAVNKDFERASD